MPFDLDYKTQLTDGIQEAIDDVYLKIKWDINDVVNDLENLIEMFYTEHSELVDTCKDFLDELSDVVRVLENLKENFDQVRLMKENGSTKKSRNT